MLVNRTIPIAALLCLAWPAAAYGPFRVGQSSPQIGSDWQIVQIDPAKLAHGVEIQFSRFHNVCVQSTLNITCPFRADPKGKGKGRVTSQSSFWSPSKFQLGYLIYEGSPTPDNKYRMQDSPSIEYLILNGTGTMRRAGDDVGPNPRFNPKNSLFNVSSDAQLVESWPSLFPRYIFSTFTKGNATLSRYITALKKGVGGYQVATWERVLRIQGQPQTEYRITATRPRKGKRLESSVEIIIGSAFLPVMIETFLGEGARVFQGHQDGPAKSSDNAKFHLNWTSSWYNNATSMLPKSPDQIGVPGTPSTGKQPSGNFSSFNDLIGKLGSGKPKAKGKGRKKH